MESPAIEESEEPVVVLKEGEDVDGDGGADEHQVEDCESHQQPVERVFPQLRSDTFSEIMPILSLSKKCAAQAVNLWCDEDEDRNEISQESKTSNHTEKDSLNKPAESKPNKKEEFNTLSQDNFLLQKYSKRLRYAVIVGLM